MTTIEVLLWICVVATWVCLIGLWREMRTWDWLKGKIRAHFKDRP